MPKFEYIRIRLMSFLDTSSGNNYQQIKQVMLYPVEVFWKRNRRRHFKFKNTRAHTDYIISVIAKNLGNYINWYNITLFNFFYRVLKKINFTKNNNFKLILVGSISIILLQTFIHIGVNIRMLPTTGMTMPFISYGGSSIVGTSILTGIILNLTREN